ncbi:MAG: flagellar basal body P-ring formation chaperone FlgA [Pseudomonadota bacterium]
MLIEQAARAALVRQADNTGLIEPQFELAVVRNDRVLPPCEQGVAVDALDIRQSTRMRMVAVCPGAAGWRYEFVVRAKVSAKVAVTLGEIPAGKPMTSADVLLERHDISMIPDTINDLTAFDGMSARRSLRGGEVLRQNMLVAVPLVKRGDAVRIVARREQIEVSMAGEALDTGARGAMVRVRNANGNTIRARVTAAGTVEPADLPLSTQSSE